MEFLKRLLGGGASGGGNDSGIYVYIRLRRSGEIVQLRLSPGQDISQDDDGRYFSRKFVTGTRSRFFEQVEAVIFFDANYRVLDADIQGGELATREDYLKQEAH